MTANVFTNINTQLQSPFKSAGVNKTAIWMQKWNCDDWMNIHNISEDLILKKHYN